MIATAHRTPSASILTASVMPQLEPGRLDHLQLSCTERAVPSIKGNPIDLSVQASRPSLSSRIVASPRWTLYCSAAPTGNTADNAGPGMRGQSNLPEQALNLPPLPPSRLPANVPAAGGKLEYLYTRSTAAVSSGTSFQVQWSDDMVTWSTAGVAQTILGDDGTTQQIKATMPAGNNRRFVRLMAQSSNRN
jgi:hypothetical protein